MGNTETSIICILLYVYIVEQVHQKNACDVNRKPKILIQVSIQVTHILILLDLIPQMEIMHEHDYQCFSRVRINNKEIEITGRKSSQLWQCFPFCNPVLLNLCWILQLNMCLSTQVTLTTKQF